MDYEEKKYLEIDFKALIQPIVYIVYVDEVCEYVGLSTQGLARVLSTSHHAISDLIYGDTPFTRLFIVVCSSKFEAEKLERAKIKELQPRRNGKQWKGNKRSRSESEQKAYVFDPYTRTLLLPD